MAKFYILHVFKISSKEEVNDSMVNGIVLHMTGVMSRNMLDLAYDEFITVTTLDTECIMRHKDRLVFYYGTKDLWSPVHFCEELLSRCPGVSAYVCKNSIEHAFVLRQGKIMAEVSANIISKEESV